MGEGLTQDSSATTLTLPSRSRWAPPSPAVRERGVYWLSRGADRGIFHLAADERLVFLEVVLEATAQAARHLVVAVLVGPGAARIEHAPRQVGAVFRHQEAEIRVLSHRHAGQ